MSEDRTRTEWTIRHWKLATRFAVEGFSGTESSLIHLRKHFLDRLQCWAQLGPSLTPEEVDRRLIEAGCDCGAGKPSARACGKCRSVLLEGVDAYVAVVAKECRGVRDAAQLRRTYRQPDEMGDGGYSGPSLVVVTNGGGYAGFAMEERSHLSTALRPLPRRVSGPLTPAHFVTVALNKLQWAKDNDLAAKKKSRH